MLKERFQSEIYKLRTKFLELCYYSLYYGNCVAEDLNYNM